MVRRLASCQMQLLSYGSGRGSHMPRQALAYVCQRCIWSECKGMCRHKAYNMIAGRLATATSNSAWHHSPVLIGAVATRLQMASACRSLWNSQLHAWSTLPPEGA